MSRALGLQTVHGHFSRLDKRVSTLERVVSKSYQYEIKVFSDGEYVVAGDGWFVFACPSDMGGRSLANAQAYVTTASSSGTVSVAVRNVTTGHDFLSASISIDATELTSYTAATASVVNAPYSEVATGDLIAIDVDAAGTAAKGLGVILTFS